MQFSNGLSNPVGLWLGHIMFDATKVIIISTIIIIVYAVAARQQLHGLGFLVSIYSSLCLGSVVLKSCTVVRSGSIRDNCSPFCILRFLDHFFSASGVRNSGGLPICYVHCKLGGTRPCGCADSISSVAVHVIILSHRHVCSIRSNILALQCGALLDFYSCPNRKRCE